MAKKTRNRRVRSLLERTVNKDAGGIDLGGEELVAAVPVDSDEEPVQTFGTTTGELHGLAQWLLSCGVKTVAMESTGNHWVAPYQILEEAGLEVKLVCAAHVKGVPGRRKTDVCDAVWLQMLHTSGLLRDSFHPQADIRRIRYLMRHRSELVASAGRAVQHMQKVLTEMNVKLHHVFSDLDGLSSMSIIRAILNGERDPGKLWSLRHGRCRATREQFVAALEGDWREEYLLVLRQRVATWDGLRAQIEECDRQISKMLSEVEGVTDDPLPDSGRRKALHKNDPHFDIRAEGWRLLGTDLTKIDGVSHGTIATLITELGSADAIVRAFPTGGHFASWLGVCPDHRKTGGKIISSKTRAVRNRVAAALRLAAYGVGRSESEIGRYCRRMKARLGKGEGITATAHKLARVIYCLIKNRAVYDEAKAFPATQKTQARRLRSLQKQAANLGMQLTPA